VPDDLPANRSGGSWLPLPPRCRNGLSEREWGRLGEQRERRREACAGPGPLMRPILWKKVDAIWIYNAGISGLILGLLIGWWGR